jgi:hypothetical protein
LGDESDAEFEERVKRTREVDDWQLMRENQLVLLELYKKLDAAKKKSLETEEDASKTLRRGRKPIAAVEKELVKLMKTEKEIERDIHDVLYGPKDEDPRHVDVHHHLTKHVLTAAEKRRARMPGYRQEQLIKENEAYKQAARGRDNRLRELRRVREGQRLDRLKKDEEKLPPDVAKAFGDMKVEAPADLDLSYEKRHAHDPHRHGTHRPSPPSPPRSLAKWLDQRTRRHSRTRSGGSGRWSETSSESD